MQLTINEQVYDIEDDAPSVLLWVIRDTLGLTGTKYGCGAGICGACTVHVDGVPTRSCVTTTESVAGKKITTIEGLSITEADGSVTLHPVQQAFLDGQVPQCSWCMSGQMMTAAAFLAENSSPTDDEITAAMGENYCRCGCYVRLRSAVVEAAAAMREGVA